MSETTEQSKPRRRDIRVDRIGFVDELSKRFVDDKEKGIKPKLKETIHDGEIVEGDFFEAQLFGSTTKSADPGVLLRLYDKGRINRSQFLDALSVKVGVCDKLGFTLDEQARLYTEAAGPARLVIKIKKGVAVSVEAALDGLVAAIKGS